MKKIYVVKYYRYSTDNMVTIFATTERSKATKYCTRFNSILKKWKEYYKQYEDNRLGITWLKEEHVNINFSRWYELRHIGPCSWQEIPVR